MPYTESKTKSGVTVHAKDSGKDYHVKSEAAAKKLEQQHEMFKHMNETTSAGKLSKAFGKLRESAAINPRAKRR